MPIIPDAKLSMPIKRNAIEMKTAEVRMPIIGKRITIIAAMATRMPKRMMMPLKPLFRLFAAVPTMILPMP